MMISISNAANYLTPSLLHFDLRSQRHGEKRRGGGGGGAIRDRYAHGPTRSGDVDIGCFLCGANLCVCRDCMINAYIYTQHRLRQLSSPAPLPPGALLYHTPSTRNPAIKFDPSISPSTPTNAKKRPGYASSKHPTTHPARGPEASRGRPKSACAGCAFLARR